MDEAVAGLSQKLYYQVKGFRGKCGLFYMMSVLAHKLE